jgi:tetratricopeptide (TPR) repeat protein
MAMVLAETGALDRAVREGRRALAEADAAGNRLSSANARKVLAHALKAQGEPAEAEALLRAAIAAGISPVFKPGEFHAALAGALLAQGRAGEALAIARDVNATSGRHLRIVWLQGTLVEAEALIALGERDAARALLAFARAELLAVASQIESEALRASFLSRGLWTARLMRLAEAEGIR